MQRVHFPFLFPMMLLLLFWSTVMACEQWTSLKGWIQVFKRTPVDPTMNMKYLLAQCSVLQEALKYGTSFSFPSVPLKCEYRMLYHTQSRWLIAQSLTPSISLIPAKSSDMIIWAMPIKTSLNYFLYFLMQENESKTKTGNSCSQIFVLVHSQHSIFLYFKMDGGCY